MGGVEKEKCLDIVLGDMRSDKLRCRIEQATRELGGCRYSAESSRGKVCCLEATVSDVEVAEKMADSILLCGTRKPGDHRGSGKIGNCKIVLCRAVVGRG